MRILAACSLGGAGHLQPLLPFLAVARRHGHETRVICPASMQAMVETAGYEFVAGCEPDESDVAPIRERLPVAPPAEASVLGNRELFGRLATTAMLPPMERICAEWKPDLVLRDPCEYASAVVASRLAIPTAQVAISLAQAEMGSIAVAAPALEEQRVGLSDQLRASPYLTRFPAALDPSPFASTFRFSEPEPDVAPTALPDWWAGSDAPLVYMTFGTVLGHMTMAADIYRVALRVVADLPVRVLLTTGRKLDPSALGPTPANVHVEPWIDQRDALATAELVVCHGGSGTVFGALAAGVPTVVVPVFADQFENGRRVAGSGAGLTVEVESDGPDGARTVIGGDDAPRIAGAITTALKRPALRTEARRIADEMAAEPGVDELLDELLRGAGAIPG